MELSLNTIKMSNALKTNTTEMKINYTLWICITLISINWNFWLHNVNKCILFVKNIEFLDFGNALWGVLKCVNNIFAFS